jgi:predicted amidohydrolase YtcJ
LSESRRAVMCGLDREFRMHALQAACTLAARHGATTLHAVEGGELFGDAYIPELLELREQLDTWIVLYWVTTDVKAARRMGLRSLGADVLLDGTFGSRTAALWEPYADAADTSGWLYKSQQEVDEFMLRAREVRMQPGVHAIGGRAIEQALNGIERAETLLPGIDNRPRVEHFGEATPAQIRRAGRLQMGVATQPPFAYLRGDPAGVYAERLGAERVQQVYAFRRMIDEGVRAAGGSDSPITPSDSVLGLHACVNAYYEAQRVSVAEALQLYTINGAWLGFEEEIKGDLKPGMNADLVVLAKNPFQVDAGQLRGIEVLLTIKGGRIVFDGRGTQDHAQNVARS